MDNRWSVRRTTTGAYDNRYYDDAAHVYEMDLIAGSQTIERFDYTYDAGSQRISQTLTTPGYSNSRNYRYDNIGQLVTATGFEQDGTPRLNEQFGYAYDKAWNLNYRTNGYLVENFNANAVNELSTISRSGTLTVAGTVGGPGSAHGTGFSVTVSGNGVPSPGTAATYNDFTWAITNVTPANGQNTYTANATDGYGRTSQDSVTANLPSSTSFTYDANGNLLGDGNRNFAYDDENQLTSVWVTNAWRSDFVYDGLMRRRVRREYTWSSGA